MDKTDPILIRNFGYCPRAYLKAILTRLDDDLNSRFDELLPCLGAVCGLTCLQITVYLAKNG